MKKTIMFLGVLAVGFANAQQEFEGKVGINTEKPKATLDVKSKTDNVGGRNLQLLNATDKKLVTVLDNGNVGIGEENPTTNLQINNSVQNPIILKNTRYAYTDNVLQNYMTFVDKNNIVYGYFGEISGDKRLGLGSSKGYDIAFGSSSENKESAFINMSSSYPNERIKFQVSSQDPSSPNQKIEYNTYLDRLGQWGIGIVPEHKLHIKANVDPLKLEGLQSTTDANAKNLVVVDGVVKVGSATSTGATQLSGTDGIECKEENRGKMNFKKGENGKSDIFGICLKNANGQYNWAYFIGGGNPTNGSGVFGSGL